MKYSKITGVILAAVMALSALAGCQNKPAESSSNASANETSSASANWTEPVKVAAIKGPTALGMVNMMKEHAQKDTTSNSFTFTVTTNPNDITAKLATKEIDIAAIPTNLAATLYNKNSSIKMLALNTLGVLYVVEKGDSIQSAKDLKGKTIYTTKQGNVPEILGYVLKQNGLDPDKDVTIEYKSAHDEVAALMASNKASIAVLPQPFVTTVLVKNKDVRIALDLTEEWGKTNDATLTMGCVVVRADFLENNKAIVDEFMKQYKASSEKAVTDVDGTAKLSQEFDIIPEAVAKQAIPKCNIVYIDNTEMKTKANSFFKILFDSNPAAVGNKLPDDGLYYIQ